jgi:two-component system, OmpR family, response regulator
MRRNGVRAGEPRRDAVKVLLVEDEARLSAMVAKGLRAEGFVVVTAATGDDGLHEALENDFDVVVLDIMLPGRSGYEVLRGMRRAKVWTPVIMLTAKDGEYEQTDAFELGADDYLIKPFSFKILVARLRALVRRGAPERPTVLTAGTLSLDPSRRLVARDDTEISLTAREFGLLEYLMRNKDIVLSKSAILANVWDVNYSGPANVVEVYVGYLRRKIDIPFGTNSIETIRGVGYRLLP